MRPTCGSLSLLVLTLATPSFTAAQTVVSDIHATDSKVCTTEQPAYADRDGKPLWFESDSLLKRATHCTSPKMPDMARSLRLEGYVSVDILVNDTGKVSCVRLANGHPMFASSAINAAKQWTFQPMKQDGKAVWFYGHLRFHFSTGKISENENPCTVGNW
jgi:TonB family protein